MDLPSGHILAGMHAEILCLSYEPEASGKAQFVSLILHGITFAFSQLPVIKAGSYEACFDALPLITIK